ncbi:hypothetical protein [Streptomyces sp. NPDC020667]|uniref:hypothetical protein n=1 Tax=Streptomyces sp. NPDC020667 TaxID=3154895 RepID=UPI0033ED5E88
MAHEALVIETDGTVRPLDLPSDREGRSSVLRAVVGGFAESARYHPGALLYVNADGAKVPNVAAWALACAWRGLDLDYYLYGPVVVTAASTGSPLTDELMGQVRTAAEAVAEVMAEWHGRSPVSPEAGIRELLAQVRFRVPAGV